MIRHLLFSLAGAMTLMALLSVLYLSRTRRRRGLSSSRTRNSKTDRLLRDAGMPPWMRTYHLLLARLVLVLVLGYLGYTLMSNVFGIAGAVIGWFVPMAALRFRRGRRQSQLNRDLTVVIAQMRTLLRSGSDLDRAIQQLAYRHAPDSYKPVFMQIYEDNRQGGLQFALERAMAKVNNPVFDRFAGFLSLNAEMGAELIPLLDLAQEQIRAQVAMMARMSSQTMQIKMGGYFIPFVLGGGLLLVQIASGPHSYWGPLFTFPGNLVEMFAYCMFFAGIYVINRLQAIPPMLRMRYRRVAR